MSVAFVLSVYKEPRLLQRLVRRLEGWDTAVHVDAKVDAAPFEAALAGQGRVHWLRRHRCDWGFFGHVDASLEGLRWFLGTRHDHVMLLTGQCYPLRPVAAFERWLEGLGGASIISHEAMPHPRWMAGGMDRIERDHVRFFGRAWHLRVGPRRMPFGLRPYGGSSYWCLSRRAAQHVIDAVDRNPALLAFFRRVWIPDEIFFQTVLANSPLRDSLVNDDVHHIEWIMHQPSPKVIDDPTLALASDKWFVRKVADERVLDRLDRAAARQLVDEAADRGAGA